MESNQGLQGTHDPKVLTIIPAYNEGEHIGEVIVQSQVHLPVLVVNDGSTDDTAEMARLAGVTVLDQVPNQGKGAALRAGFRWAIEHGYDAVITLDADGQHDPAEIPSFLAAFEGPAHSDLVIGARTFDQMPLTRRIANTLGRAIFSWAVGQPVPDNQSGYRLISRRLMESTLASAEQGFEFEVEMIVVCLQNDYRLTWVPIRTIYANQGSHIRPGPHVLNFFRVVWRTRRALRRTSSPAAS